MSSAPAASSSAAPRSSARRTIAALGVSIGSFATLQSLLVPVLPVMQLDLGTDTAGIAWALTAWLIASAVATPLLGRVGDIVGRRRTLLLALGSVALGSVVAALAPSLGVLLAGRVLQGLGGAAFPLAFGIVRDALPPARVASGIGVLSALMAIGSGVGTVLAGPLSELVGWRGLFLFPLIGVTIGGLLVLLGVPDQGERAPGRLNVPAAILLSGWLVALLIPLSTGPSWGWGSPAVLGLLALAAVLLAAWIVVELRSREPLVDMRMMALPGVWNTNLAAILVGATMFGLWAYFARFVQEPVSTGYGLGATVSQAGLVMLPMLVLMAVAGFVTGPLGRVLTPSRQLAGAGVLLAVSTASIAVLHSSFAALAIAGAGLGFGIGIAFSSITTIVVQSVPPTQTSVASGVNSNLRTIGSAIGTTLMTAIVTGSATGAGGEPTEASYQTGFLVLAALGLAASVAALAGRPGRARRGPEPEPVVESPFAGADAV